MDATLRRLSKAIMKAENAMQAELRKRYPTGTVLRFTIQYGQVNPSVGTVISHEGGIYAQVRCRLHSRANDVRSVSVDRIIGRA